MINLTNAALSHSPYWAIDATAARSIWHQLQITDAAEHRAEYAAARAEYMDSEAKPSKPYQVDVNGLVVLALSGVMTKAPTSMSYYGGGTSTALLRWQIRKAAADDDVKAILLLVDSPGGEVAGTEDLADDIKVAARKKPFDAYIQDQCCSAAYWAISGVRRITSNSSALIGSLGVMMAITDASAQAEGLGLEVIVFKTAEVKGAGTPGTEITEPQREMFQGIVNGFGEMFLAAIQKGRKFTKVKALEVFDARIHHPETAKSLGLIDGIGSLDSATADIAACIGLGEESDIDASTPQVSAPAESTGLPGAGKTATTVAGANQNMSLKNSLAQALARFNLGRMVTAVINSPSDDPESLSATMASEVAAEVDSQVKSNPLLVACAGHGIHTLDDLTKVINAKKLGDSFVATLRAEAKKEAVRAFGNVDGPIFSVQVDHLDPANVETLRNTWQAQADAGFGITDDGKTPPARKTAPAATSVDVEANQKPERAWDRIPPDQQAIAKKTTDLSTVEKQDAFAANYLKEGN